MANLKLRVLPRLPVSVQGANGIAASVSNGVMTIQPSWTDLALITNFSSPETRQIWSYDPATGVYGRVSLQAVLDALLTTRYQGALPTPPTQRPDGSAIQSGDLYFDTVIEQFRAYDGTDWITAGTYPAGATATKRYRFVATAGQTVFSGLDTNGQTLGYTAGGAFIFLNGVLLDPSDMTATDGTSITLNDAAAVSDEIIVWSIGHFSYEDALPLSGGTMGGNLALPAGGLIVGTNQLVVKLDGKIGHGTATPSSEVHHSRAGDFQIIQDALSSSAVSVYRMRTGDNTTSARFSYFRFETLETVPQDWRIGLYGDKNISFRDETNGSYPLTLQNAGNPALFTVAVRLPGNPSNVLDAAPKQYVDTKQPLDATLTALAGVTTAADKVIYATGVDTFTTTDQTAFARTLLDDADAATARTTLGLVIGTNVQAFDSELAAIAGLTSAADRLPYFTGSGTAALATFTSAGRALVDDADATAQRTTLGLGTIATQAASAVAITGGTIASITSLGVNKSPTSTAQISKSAPATSVSRANLHLSIGGSADITATGDYNLIGFGYDDGGTGYSAYMGFRETSFTGAQGKGDLIFGTNSAVTTGSTPSERMRIDSNGSVIVSAAALATNATDGFLYIPTCAGAPSGTPTAYTGRVPLIYDTTNHKLYIYDGGWKGGTAPGAWS